MDKTPTGEERPVAERILAEFYTRLGRSTPRFIWFDGPLSCLFAAHLLRVSRVQLTPLSFDASSAAQFRGRLWRTLDVHLQRRVRNLGTSRGDSRDPDFHHWFWGDFWSQCVQQGLPSLAKRLDPIGCQMEPMRFLGGAWRGALVPQGTDEEPSDEQTPWLDELQDSCGWWFPFEQAVLCADEPRRIHVDGRGRLHAEHGPSLRLSAKHHEYAWHGTPIPADFIERRSELDSLLALSWSDLEQRRALIEIIGWAKLIAALPTRIIDSDRNPEVGTLVECNLPGDPASRFLRVRCGTGREFALRVPRELTSARDANAWTYGLTGDQYQLEART